MYSTSKLIISKDITEIYNLLDNNFEQTIEEIFVTLLENIYNNDFYNSLLILEYVEQIIENENNFDNLNFITNKVIEVNKNLNKKKNKSSEFQNIKFRLVCLNSSIINKTKSPKSKDKNLYNYLLYLIFEDRNLDLIENYINSEKRILTIEQNSTNILIKILEYYMELDSANKDEIEYMYKIINLFLNDNNYNILLNNKNKYYNILYNSKYENKLHINNICDCFKCYYRVDTALLEQKYDISYNFSDEIEKESLLLNPNSLNRVDYTKQNTITIDCKGAVCLDDALCLEKNIDGTYKLYVHILDIPSVIPYNSIIDREAYKRAESLYLDDIDIPLYPYNVIKNNCSLFPDIFRNAVTYSVSINTDYSIIEDSFKEELSVVSIKNRLTYDEVDERINNLTEDLLDIMLERLALVTLRLKAVTFKKETYRKVDNIFNTNKSCHSLYTDNSISNNIVHETAVLTNYLKGKYMKNNGYPYGYRIHIPDTELEKLISDKPKFILKRKNIEIIENNYLNASYSNIPNPHYGLGLDIYSHSTSPGRRYMDALGQYISYDIIHRRNIEDKNIYNWEDIIKEACNYLNKRQAENKKFINEYNTKSLVRKK